MSELPPIAILAGGLATRMRPLTEKIPKALLEVAGKPFIVHQVELLRSYGITKIVMCIGFLGEMIEAELGDGSAYGVEIQLLS
jgi:NDP-sugar pyrophosphorylase family protein